MTLLTYLADFDELQGGLRMIDWTKYKNLSDFIRSHKEYLEVASECIDELLLYPTISGRKTSPSQAEIEYKALRKIMRI